MMCLIFTWIRRNKIKFFFVDSILLLVNIIIVTIVQTGVLIEFDQILIFIAITSFFCLVSFISKIWLWIIQKFHITIRLYIFFELISYYMINFFVSVNIIMMFIIWVQRDQLIIFYFAMPWLIIISVNIYNSMINFKDKIDKIDNSKGKSVN